MEEMDTAEFSKNLVQKIKEKDEELIRSLRDNQSLRKELEAT